jgi:anti-sigma regulatory factor (Ser/Thr protein kinase)
MTGPMRFREVFPGGEKAAGHARRVLERWLADAVPAHRLGDLQLLVTEIVANCVRHGGVGEGGRIDLQVDVGRANARVEVRDTGIQADPRVRRPDLSGGGGFGMVLVERLSTAWGIDHEPGVVMWFELDLDRAGGAGALGRAARRERRPLSRRTRTALRARRHGRRHGPQARIRLRLALGAAF